MNFGKLILCLAGAVCLWPGRLPAQSAITLTVSNVPGRLIPDDFGGVSFGAVAELAGSGGAAGCFFSGTNTELITLFRNSGIHNLRLGGSTVEGMRAARPGPAAIDSVFAFARAAGVDVIYSLPLLNGDRAADAVTAKYIWDRYRSLLAYFAIGNEPDIERYHYPPFGSGSDPLITNYSSYLAQWNRFAAAVSAAVPGAKFAGPDAANRSWAKWFARDEANSGIVDLITQHYYVGGRPYIIDASGVTNPVPASLAIDNMLSSGWVAAKYPALYKTAVAPAMAGGLPCRLTESDDYLKGIAGASDAFASALWALDYLHWWAAHGCAGVNFHNTEWLKTDTVYLDAATRSHCINPKAYALKAFDLGSHGRVEPVALAHAADVNLTAYAVGGPDALYVTLINKEHGPGGRAATVAILPAGFSLAGAEVMFLSSPNGNAGAMSGITLGGAGINNHDVWHGEWTPLAAADHGQYAVKVPATTAAIVKISTH